MQQLINPMRFDTNTATPINKEDLGVSFDFFKSDAAKNVKTETTSIETKKKSSGTRKPKDNGITIASSMVQPNGSPSSEFSKSYEETNNMLRNTIMQTDILSQEISKDISDIRASKTIKNKYTYLTNLNSSASALISTKIQAIRELNNSINQIHNLELKRQKDANDANKKSDDARLMELYTAYINTPIGNYSGVNPLSTPSMQELTSIANNPNVELQPIDANPNGYNNFVAAMTPEQNRMRYDNNPNIKTVVVYNQDTGQRFFDVIDQTTGQSIPNVAKPGDFLLADTTIDVHNNVAKNRNIDTSWPLVLIGGGKINEY